MELIRFANDVLLAVGERPQVSLSNTVGRKAALAVRDALEDFQLANNWSFLKTRVLPLSKIGVVLTIPTLRQIQSVFFKDRALLPVNIEELYSGVYYSFAVTGDASIEVSKDLDGEAASDFSIIGYTLLTINLLNENSLLPLPDQFLPILRTQAVYRMAIDHLGDAALAQVKSQEFTRLVQAYQVRETGVGRRNQNLYRKRT
jgi:hypothetical protein